MTDIALGIASFPVLLVLIFLRVPIGLAMFVTGLVGMVLVTGDTAVAFGRLRHESFSTFSNYSLSIVPMFLVMGHFATLGGMSKALFNAAESWLGHRKGGVAMAAVGACAGFGAICGSSLATAATMSKVAMPEMRRLGYAGGFSTATLAAGGTLGILIPPSVVLVIYAILTEQNIAKLFLAAFIPGLMAAAGYMLVIAIYVRIYPQSAGLQVRRPYAARLRAMLDVWPVLTLFLLVVGGIYLGWFTPTEAAAIGAFGTGLMAYFSGGLTRSSLAKCFFETGKSTAMIFFIILGAAFYNGFLALTQVPQEIGIWVGTQGFSPFTILLFIICFYLILGCFMDSLSMILLTIPIFWPVVMELDFTFVTLAELHAHRAHEALAAGIQLAPEMLESIKTSLANGMELTRDQIKALELRGVSKGALGRLNTEQLAIWFGVLVLIVVEVGLITPPVGMNLFILNAMDKETPIQDTYKAVLFFVASDLTRVILLLAFPVITLGLIAW
jgi:tripartite ATP-independent transporter DctM subunit